MADSRGTVRVLVPLDRSPEAERVLAALMPLGRRRSLRVTAVHVQPPGSPPDDAKAYLSKACRVLFFQGIPACSRVDTGDPAEEILELADPRSFDLVAMSTHGRTGLRRLVLGSVTEAVVRGSDIPVVVLPPGVAVKDWGRIVVALDGSPRAEGVLGDVLPMAKVLGAGLYLLHVQGLLHPLESSQGYLEQLSARLKARGIPSVPIVRRGPFAEEIARFAREAEAGLIAVATEGRRGMERAILGSVAEEVLRTAPCAVLVRSKSGRSLQRPAPVQEVR